MYEITRVEKGKNREGKDEVFIAMEVTDELGKYNYGHWLTPAELKSYLADEDNISIISTIADSHVVKAKNNYQASLAAIEAEQLAAKESLKESF